MLGHTGGLDEELLMAFDAETFRPQPSAPLHGEQFGSFKIDPQVSKPGIRGNFRGSSLQPQSETELRQHASLLIPPFPGVHPFMSLPQSFLSPKPVPNKVLAAKESCDVSSSKKPSPKTQAPSSIAIGSPQDNHPFTDPKIEKVGRVVKERVIGGERFEFIADKDKRKASQSKQIKQVKMDLARLLLTTGAHSALIVIPDSLKVHKFATAGDFNSFLQMYASLISEQKKKKRYEVKFRIDDLWETFHGQGGLHQIESLCSALHEANCNEGAVENFKDAFLASLVADPKEARKSLAEVLNHAIMEFTRLKQSD